MSDEALLVAAAGAIAVALWVLSIPSVARPSPAEIRRTKMRINAEATSARWERVFAQENRLAAMRDRLEGYKDDLRSISNACKPH